MNPRAWKLTFFFAAVVGVMVAAGCGSTDEDPCNPTPVVNIKNGTWVEVGTVTETGTNVELCFTDSTLTSPDTMFVYTQTDTAIFCDLLPAGRSTETCCTSEINGNQITFDCVLRFPFANPCEVRLEITGSGTFTDTTYNLNVLCLELPVTGPRDPCDVYIPEGFGDTCRVEFQRVGTWLSADGDSICTPGSTAIQGETFIESMIARMGVGRR